MKESLRRRQTMEVLHHDPDHATAFKGKGHLISQVSRLVAVSKVIAMARSKCSIGV